MENAIIAFYGSYLQVTTEILFCQQHTIRLYYLYSQVEEKFYLFVVYWISRSR